MATPNPSVTEVDVEAQLNGDRCEKASGRLWLWSTEAGERERYMEIAESWESEDADAWGIFVCAGLFSIAVITFIFQSYRLLSPDSVDEAKAFFTQLSQQLVDISNGTPIQNVVEAHGIAPFKPTASAIRINVLLFLSLFLSLTCVIFAGVIQRRARRYTKLAPCAHKRARMHVDTLSDTKKSQMSRAIETTTTLLHISIFLFSAGLVEFLFHINKTIAFYALGYISAAAFVYIALTALPYRTSH